MNNALTFVSYTLAAMAGIFFVKGLVVLSGGGEKAHGKYGSSSIDA